MLSFPLTLLRLPPVSLSFLTSAEYPPMPMSGCLRGQLISSASYYEYLWLPSSSVCFSPTISLGSSPVSPRIRRRSSSHSVLVGEELKHIRPALELRLHCKWESRGERENSPWHWRVLVNPWKAPRTSKLSPNITATLSVSQRQTTERRAANSLMGKHYGARHCEPFGPNGGHDNRNYSRENETDYFSSRTTDRDCIEWYAFP